VGDRALSYQLSIPGSGLNSYRLNDSETCESLRKVFITAGGTGVCSGNALGRGLLVFLCKGGWGWSAQGAMLIYPRGGWGKNV
jgi:hypothetical protein